MDTNDQFLISFVYGSNEDRSRRALWESLCSNQQGSPWIVLGDFNVYRRVDESIGGCSRITVAMEDFAECLQASELDNLRFSGFLHTWINKRSNGCISKKLDRVLVNNEWLVKFENSEASFLPPSISDDCPARVARIFLVALCHLDMVFLTLRNIIDNVISNVISNDQADSMDRHVTNDEIKEVCFSLHPNKAPGLDGFNAHFIKKTWDIVGEDVINAIQKFFRYGHLLKELNATILALVPKVPNPSKMKDFRPISCCNTLYKIIAKIIANRIKPCLPHIISPSQSAFVAGRSIGDNILLAQELMRNYHKDIGSARLTLKVDLMKAFDMVDWGFLLETFTAFHFAPKIITWIKACLTTPKFSISFNGELAGFFSGKMGLWQGDLMSPYLFVIAMKVLSKILTKRIADSPSFKFHWKCDKIKLSHLCFADGLIMLCHGSPSSVLVLKATLDEFSLISGLLANQAKSNIFTSGLSSTTNQQLINLFGYMHFIGNGSSTSFWFNNWHPDGPLISKWSPCVVYDSCLPLNATVNAIVLGDSWSWPTAMSIDLVKIRSRMHSYNPNSNIEDSIQWLPSSNGIYSASSTLASLRAPHPLVPWFKLVWFPQNILRMSFILWMAVRGRLSTRDRIHKYDPRAVTTCVLCNSHLESYAYQFFECLFSTAIWTQLLNYCGTPWNGLYWNAFIAWASTHWRGNTPIIVAKKLCLGAAVYHIWREHNCRIFDGTQRTSSVVVRSVFLLPFLL
ncbi:hypothetical protein Dsin_001840 [Dipteronia sinensis]|uniref:Reverse transcriptase domain-containing protein n=1 Tax=Dipteronia sinensis TaxID=43782 RepID=A0AAE0EJ47_9ROSI|nr:hypothetical protein Dsin_001840 [Dipteronia sinensis]